ncbi:multidrug MFS transporter [Lysinibacillus sp. FJAT-14745]|uniref:MDR family MFS transporter n=1 Tax=Lysinibacillus sp. FJAT-14745 TaxID=1704289 RepID=UPI0006AB7D4F|nr:MDR family MFS transporter [Lysinibacillus sp. FJAT-14745]KOP69469.1 multidrug MFS transporter [Lysinibacillus sp. FJAT-14745]
MNITITNSTSSKVDLSNIRHKPIIIALILGAMVAFLNETLLGNALTVLMKEFDVSASTIQWLSTAYMLVVGVLVPITALLQQWFTTRQMFLSAMIIFLVGTLIAGFAPTFSVLLIGRIVQAIATGLISPLLMNTILIICPPEKRGATMGLIGLVMMFSPAVGPTLSGLIVDSLNWRWLFYTVIPIVIISILIGMKYIQNVTELTRPKVDYLSILLSTLGFGGIVYSFSASGDLGWSDSKVYYSLIIGAISLVIFVVRQLKIDNPILELRAFKFPMFTLTVVLMFIVMMSLFASMTLLPMFLQTVLLVTAFKSGLIMLPGSIVSGIMGPVAGKLFDKLSPKTIIIPGIGLVAGAMWLFKGINPETTLTQIILMHSLLMIGLMFVMTAQTYGLNQLTPELYPHGTAIFNTLSQVAGAIGTAIFISKMSSGTTKYMENSATPMDPVEQLNGLTSGFQGAFMLGLIFIIIALVASFFLKGQKKKVKATQLSYEEN